MNKQLQVQIVHDDVYGYAIALDTNYPVPGSVKHILDSANSVKFWKKLSTAQKNLAIFMSQTKVYSHNDIVGTY